MKYAMLDTLTNPILSDHFGFRVKEQYYIVLGISATLFISSCLLYVATITFKAVGLLWSDMILLAIVLTVMTKDLDHPLYTSA